MARSTPAFLRRRSTLITAGGLVLALAAGGIAWERSGDDAAEEAASCRKLLPEGSEDSSSVEACGKALEEAMTGRSPGAAPPDGSVRHSAAQTRTFANVVRAYGAPDEGDAARPVPEGIRRNVGSGLASFPVEIYDALRMTRPSTPVAGGREVAGADLRRILRSVAEDDGGFRSVHDSQAAYVTNRLGQLDKGDFTEEAPAGRGDRAQQVAHDCGKALGALYKARDRALRDGSDPDTPETKDALIDNHDRNGFPLLERLLTERAKKAGLTSDEIGESGGRMQVIYEAAETAFQSG